MHKALFAVGVGLWITACSSELQPVEFSACTELALQDQVELVITTSDPIALRLSEGVEFESSSTLKLSGVGQAFLGCSDLSSIQALGESKLYAERAPNLLSLKAYGRSEIAIDEVGTSMLEVRASGQAKIAIAALDADGLDLQGGGQSQIALQGSVGEAFLNVAGSAAVDVSSLRAQDVSLSGPGTGDVALWATAHLQISPDVVREPSVVGNPDITDGRAGSQ